MSDAGLPTSNRVLVIEDEPDLQLLWRSILRSEGYGVIEARDGADALGLARRESPDLIMLDANLPNLSGWDVLRALKADPELAGIPVVMVTGESSSDAEKLAGRLGAARFLTKPLDVAELVEEVRTILR